MITMDTFVRKVPDSNPSFDHLTVETSQQYCQSFEIVSLPSPCLHSIPVPSDQRLNPASRTSAHLVVSGHSASQNRIISTAALTLCGHADGSETASVAAPFSSENCREAKHRSTKALRVQVPIINTVP